MTCKKALKALKALKVLAGKTKRHENNNNSKHKECRVYEAMIERIIFIIERSSGLPQGWVVTNFFKVRVIKGGL